MRSYQSWGRLPDTTPTAVHRIDWRSDLAALDFGAGPVLAHGLGRSYGDSCLNDGGTLIDTTGLDRLIHFDSDRGIVRCEAGVSILDLLDAQGYRCALGSVYPLDAHIASVRFASWWIGRGAEPPGLATASVPIFSKPNG